MSIRNLSAILTFLVSVACSYSVSGAEQASLNLSDAIRFTLDQNPQFRSFQFREQALQGEMQITSLKPAMQVSTEIENVLGTGDLNWFQGTEITLALSQIIELGNKREARTNTVSQRQTLLQAEQRILELDLLSQVTSRFIELAAAEERLALLQRTADLSAEIFEAVNDRLVVGRASDAELARATADLSLAQLAVQSAEYEVAASIIRLSSLWNELSPQFDSAQANLLQIGSLAPISDLLQQLSENPLIEVFASESRVREAELQEARSRSRANLQVGVGIRHLAELNDTALVFQASIPLRSESRSRGYVTAAQANLLRTGTERETALLRLKTQLLTLDQQRQLAANELSVLRDVILPQQNNALDATRDGFESGRYSYLETSIAQKAVLDTEMAMIEAATRAHLLRVEIERLSGEAYRNTVVPIQGGTQ